MRANLILAGDVGGTKTLLEVGSLDAGRWQGRFARRYAAAEHAGLQDVLGNFLAQWRAAHPGAGDIGRACLGVAGPVQDNRARLTNLPWLADGAALARACGIGTVRIVNDFAAAASGIDLLAPDELAVLQAGRPRSQGPRLVLGAGTGLGVACMVWNGTHHAVVPGEGGHVGFAPATAEQAELWRELFAQQGRVTAEDIVSGPGLARLHDFVVRRAAAAHAGMPATPAAVVQGAAAGDALCNHALELFIACYGQVAGNLALPILPHGGVYVAGGIAPRILARLQQGAFLAAFNNRGTHSALMRELPVAVVTNTRLGLLGAAAIAGRLAQP